MTHLTLAAIRSMLPHGATSHHLAHAAWLALELYRNDCHDGGASMWAPLDSLNRWVATHPSMGTLTVTYTYPDECPKIGQYETL